MIQAEAKKHNHFLDSLRGLAALWVVFNHAQGYLPNTLDQIPSFIRTPLIHYGGLGVPVFFVLSGYVIAASLERTQMDAPAYGNFMARRLLRITPPYYAAVVFQIIVTFVSTRAKHEPYLVPTVGRVVAHALYLPDLLNMEMFNGVHWTLYLEMQFYILFGLLLWAIAVLGRRYRHTTVVAMSLVAAISLSYPILVARDTRENWFLPYVHAFVFGFLVQFTRSKRLHPAVLATFVVGLGVAWALHTDSVVGAGFVAGLIVLATTGPRGGFGLLEQRPFRFLGKISFSLYLVHSPVMGSVSYVGDRILGDSTAAELVTLASEIVASFLVATVFWRLFEEPAVRWSKSLRRPTRTVQAANAVAAN